LDSFTSTYKQSVLDTKEAKEQEIRAEKERKQREAEKELAMKREIEAKMKV